MRRRQFMGLLMVATLCVAGCGKSLSEQAVGTWQVLEDGKPRADGYAITLEADGAGKLSTGGDLTWQQYPNMAYITMSFGDGGTMTMKLASDDEGELDIAGEKLPLRRKK
jgi:hypothetical protein